MSICSRECYYPHCNPLCNPVAAAEAHKSCEGLECADLAFGPDHSLVCDDASE